MTVKDVSPRLKVSDVLPGKYESGMFRENSMYIIYSETDHQPRWEKGDTCSGLVHWEGGSGWGIHVTPWLIHVSV